MRQHVMLRIATCNFGLVFFPIFSFYARGNPQQKEWEGQGYGSMVLFPIPFYKEFWLWNLDLFLLCQNSPHVILLPSEKVCC